MQRALLRHAVSPLRLLLITFSLSLLGYVALLLLLQSGQLWEVTSPLQDRLPLLFGRLNDLLPYSPARAAVQVGPGITATVLYIVVLLWLFAVFIGGLWAAKQTRLTGASAKGMLRGILLGAAVLLALVFFSREIFDVDVFAYSFFGRIWAVFGANPYVHVPSEFAAQDTSGWLQYIYWRDLPCPYGPLWLVLAGGVAWVANLLGGDLALYEAGNKLLADGAHLLNIWLVWQVAGLLADRRVQTLADAEAGSSHAQTSNGAQAAGKLRFQLLATLAYAWNPLMLIEFGISGHNDVLMLTPVLAALLLQLRGYWRWAVFALALACLVKFTAIIFLPGYLWLLLWSNKQRSAAPSTRQMGKVAQAALIFAATVAVCYLPFRQGPSTLNVLFNDPTATYFIHSLSTFANRYLPPFMSAVAGLVSGSEPGNTPQALQPFASFISRWVPLLITAVAACMLTWKARSTEGMIKAWGWVLFVLLTVGLSWFWPWYVAWLLVPAALSGSRHLLNATVALSFSSLLVYCVNEPVRAVWPDARLWVGLFVMGIPLVYVAIGRWGKGSREF